MLLVIDVGNTNMEFGVYRGEELVGSFRLMTDANRTSDELGLWLCQYFQRFGLELGQVEDVVIGSVAPQVMHTLSRAVQKYVGKTPLVLDEALDPGLPYVECDSDERLGPDRAAADIAAIAKYGAPLVVLDFGTATTLDAVSREGVYLGISSADASLIRFTLLNSFSRAFFVFSPIPFKIGRASCRERV